MIAVLGAGAFGTALAISLGSNGPLTLWGRNAKDLAQDRENAARLPGFRFPGTLSITSQLDRATQAETLLVAIPLQKLRSFLEQARPALAGKTLVACCKGIELNTAKGPVGVIDDVIPDARSAILTGPSFASDIARGLPTALTLACRDDTLGAALQQALTTRDLRLYRTTDTVGAELGGALKNVIAIACGAAMGAGLGESARAALMTRGYAEMQRLAAQRAADPRTLSGLSGFGDLTLTCTSAQSRNYRLGLSIGAGDAFDDAVTVEGAATARAVHAFAQQSGLDLPITAAVAGLVAGTLDVRTAMHSLLNRPLKEE